MEKESIVKQKKIQKTVKQDETKQKEVMSDTKAEKIYQKRFEKYHDELRWLYMELYQNCSMFSEL